MNTAFLPSMPLALSYPLLFGVLRRGQKVAVAEYGDGEIRGFDGDKVEVAFADGQVRKFKRQFLEPRRRSSRCSR